MKINIVAKLLIPKSLNSKASGPTVLLVQKISKKDSHGILKLLASQDQFSIAEVSFSCQHRKPTAEKNSLIFEKEIDDISPDYIKKLMGLGWKLNKQTAAHYKLTP